MNFKYFNSTALICFIIVLAILYSGLSHKLITLIKISDSASQINESIHIISTLSLITISLAFINFKGWKWRIFKWLIDIPDLNGRYKGELVSSYPDPGNPVVKDCVVEIRQTASSIKIFSYFGSKDVQTSSSFSISEEIVRDHDGFFTLYYFFSNKVNTLQSQLLKKQLRIYNHSGSQECKYYPDKKILEGEYFNNRQNFGTLKVKFEQYTLLRRLIP